MRTTGALLTSMLLLCSGCSRRHDVTAVRSDDVDYNAAIAAARASLPHFWQVLASPTRGERGFALKVRFVTDSGSAEHLWTTDVVRVGDTIHATIDNDPEWVRQVEAGDRVTVRETDISDWQYLRGGKFVGNFTLRAGLKNMPPAEAARYRDSMADP